MDWRAKCALAPSGTDLRPFEAAGLELDVCPACRGLWFDAGELSEMVSAAAVQRLFHGLEDQPGACRGCGAGLADGEERCPSCARPALACPECGRAPLRVASARGVQADVCPGCRGIWLDHRELTALAGEGQDLSGIEAAARRARPAPAAPVPTATGRGGYSLRTTCASCGRELRKAHALVEGRLVYCKACAPAGAEPFSKDPTAFAATSGQSYMPESRTESDPFDEAVRLLGRPHRRGGRFHSGDDAADIAISLFLRHFLE